jgi:hypothetical protein
MLSHFAAKRRNVLSFTADAKALTRFAVLKFPGPVNHRDPLSAETSHAHLTTAASLPAADCTACEHGVAGCDLIRLDGILFFEEGAHVLDKARATESGAGEMGVIGFCGK